MTTYDIMWQQSMTEQTTLAYHIQGITLLQLVEWLRVEQAIVSTYTFGPTISILSKSLARRKLF